jgi:hypothetical protein
MSAACFELWNANTSALTAPMAGQATSGAAGTVRTMLQLKTGGGKIRVTEWGYIFTASPTAPVQMELIETGVVFATGLSTGNVLNFNDVTGPASQTATPGAASTGFNTGTGGEGTITATRLLEQQLDLATYFKQQFPLGREPEVNAGSSLRIRATPSSSAAVTVLCYIQWEE